jgi:hypothetical protein
MSDKPPRDPGVALGIIDRLLTFMNAPWKAVVVIVLLIVCGLGWLIYDQRARIADAVLRGPITVATLDVVRFTRDVGALLHETRADVAVLAEVHLTDNIVIDRVGFTRDNVLWVPIEGPQPAILPGGDTSLIARFLANEVICMDTSKAVNEEAKALHAAGYTRVCMVQVPPVLGVGVGALIVAWKVALDPNAELRAGLSMSSQSMKLATW